MLIGYSPQVPNALRQMARQYGSRTAPGYTPEGAMDWAPPGNAVMRQAQIARGAYGFMPAGGRASGHETEGSGGSRGIFRGARLGAGEGAMLPAIVRRANGTCYINVGGGSDPNASEFLRQVDIVCPQPGECPVAEAKGWPWWLLIVGIGVGVAGTTVMGRSKR